MKIEKFAKAKKDVRLQLQQTLSKSRLAGLTNMYNCVRRLGRDELGNMKNDMCQMIGEGFPRRARKNNDMH